MKLIHQFSPIERFGMVLSIERSGMPFAEISWDESLLDNSRRSSNLSLQV
jgi:hypothetical protein